MGKSQDDILTTLTLSATRGRSNQEQRCAACGARFVPFEDSGSRVLSATVPEQGPFTALMCGGCFSKWSHGATMTLRGETSA